MSEKQKILGALLREELPRGNTDFRVLLSRLAHLHLNKDAAEAARFADANLRKYWNWLHSVLDEHKRRGIRPYFVVPSSASYAIACGGRELAASSDAESQLLGACLRTRSNILRQIDTLSDRAYEALAVVTCNHIGAANVFLTPPGNEGGIDFFADIVVDRPNPKFPTIGARLRIVGQCKKYSGPLTVDKFEQFLTTMQNVRHRSDRVRRHIPSWFQDASAPIVGWMISHQGFQTGAADEAKQHGIFFSDSVDLAEILSHARIINPFVPTAGQTTAIANACLLALPNP